MKKYTIERGGMHLSKNEEAIAECQKEGEKGG